MVVRCTGDNPQAKATCLVFGLGLHLVQYHARIQRGDRGPDPHPLESNKARGLLNTGQDPLENHKATNSAFAFRPLSARQQSAT